ncbi:MAG: hypothetical protein QF387_06315, partial [Arenicellales bacterium]|nr:hypothetical protein [Arenicellales bacterium]
AMAPDEKSDKGKNAVNCPMNVFTIFSPSKKLNKTINTIAIEARGFNEANILFTTPSCCRTG